MMLARLNGSALRMCSFSVPSGLKRRSWNRMLRWPGPRGTLLKRVGQSWLVSTFGSSIGAAIPVSFLNGSITRPPSLSTFDFSFDDLADIGDAPLERGRRRHRGTDEMRAAARALPAAEVPVRGRRAALARLQLVAVEGGAERAARLAPLEARREEDAVEALPLRLGAHGPRPRHDPRRDHRLPVLRDLRRGAQVLDARVGARADEDAVD